MSEKSDGRQVYCVITDKDGNTLQTRTATLHRNGVFHKNLVKVSVYLKALSDFQNYTVKRKYGKASVCSRVYT